jgi:hypothetical protein
MQGINANILTYTDKINSFKKKLTLCGVRIKKGIKVEMFELKTCCRLRKNLVDLILQNFPLLKINIENYLTYLMYLPWTGKRSVCIKCVRENIIY